MRLMLVSLAQAVLVLSPSASADTGVDCGDWPNARFFEIASPNNVLDCLATGADPNVRAGLGWTPLHVAAGFSEHPAVIEALVAAGADLEARSGLGMTPLHVAAVTERQYGNIDSVRDFETDKVLGGAYEEHSPETAREREMGSEAMEKYHKALMNHEDAENLEKLRQWIVTTTEVQESLGKTDIERDKLVAETAKTVINSEGSIGVREAKASEHPEVIEALAAAGADLEARNENGWTPLHVAAGFSQHPAVIEALVAAGAVLEARLESGLTPLHVAAGFSQHPEVIEALVAAGADLEARDEDGSIPWDLAKPRESLKTSNVYWQLNEARF